MSVILCEGALSLVSLQPLNNHHSSSFLPVFCLLIFLCPSRPFRFPSPRRAVSPSLSQCVRTGGINYWPPAAHSTTTTSFLIEGINEWSACEMIRCPKSCLAVCLCEECEGGLFDQSCITNAVLPQRHLKQLTCPSSSSSPANHPQAGGKTAQYRNAQQGHVYFTD